jgi:trimeric autotransporter adhesin
MAAACFRAASAAPATSYVIQTVAGSDNTGDGGPALAAALGQPEGIAVDNAGNIYIADAADNRVRKIAPDGSIQTYAGTGRAGFSGDGGPATAAQLSQPYGISLDRAGNLYIADLGNARVRKVSIDGTIQTVAGGGSFPAANSGQGGPATSVEFIQPRNVALDGGGSLFISDFGANQVYSVARDGTLMLAAGTGEPGFSGDNSGALLAQLNAPAGLAVDAAGAVYIADSGNNRVRKVYGGTIITVFHTPGPTGLAFDSRGALYIAASGYFGTPSQQNSIVASAIDVAADQSGDLFVSGGSYVREISAGGTLTTVAGNGVSQNFGGDNGPASAARLSSPTGVAMDADGNWYIADTLNNRIRMVTPGGVIRTIAGTGPAGSAGDNGPAMAAQLNAPRGLAFDIFGNLLIADSGSNEIRTVSPAGLIGTLPVGVPLKNPISVVSDVQGSIYIADSGNNQIVKVTSSGVSGVLAQIAQPQAIAIDSSGNVLVADATQVWRVTPAGAASTLLPGLSSPGGLAFASDGSLFIADTGANMIRQWTASGSLNTIGGTGASGFTGDGGAALSAQLNGPSGIGVGPNGTLWIADAGNNRIRSLTPFGIAPETAPITIVNAASLAAGAIAPGEIVTVFGSGFDTSHTQLLFDGMPATLFYAGSTQINALAPSYLAANSTSVVSVAVNGTPLALTSTAVVGAAPGIFTANGGGTGQAAAINQNASLNSESNPAPRGSIVSFYATGQGSGSGTFVLTVGGYPAELPYAGPAPGFSGLMQINAQIPTGFLAPGIQQVLLSIGGVRSQAGVTIAIQ